MTSATARPTSTPLDRAEPQPIAPSPSVRAARVSAAMVLATRSGPNERAARMLDLAAADIG